MIGVFDSGVGGLSVLAELKTQMPHANYLYFADLKHVPYGDKTPEQILSLTTRAADWMQSRGAQCLVVACNTASAMALPVLRSRNTFPIIGLVPAVKPAVSLSVSGRIMVLVTAATAKSAFLQETIRQFAPLPTRVRVLVRPELVPLIEQNMQHSPQMVAILQETLAPELALGADALVLGCTHYLFLKPILSKLYPHLKLVDSGEAVAKQTQKVLQQSNITVPQAAKTVYASSLDPASASERIYALLGERVTVEQV